MIRTIEIPAERWSLFLKTLNQLASGRPVRLEVARPDLGDQQIGDLLPLLGVDLETKGSERGALVIGIDSLRGELTHVIGKPTRMAVGVNEANEPQWLAIDEDGEATTIIHFERLPALEQDTGVRT